ncbi:uncharacterized protein [Penaeus vannamei]|uniref:uncharacterized protein n=1 Tax=Penaeus vannamei TaxID=6689 RepID=UPI00387F791C
MSSQTQHTHSRLTTILSEGCVKISVPRCTSSQSTVQILNFQENNIGVATSWALLPAPPSLPSFTLCYSIQVSRYRAAATLFSYAYSDSADNEIVVDYSVGGVALAVRGVWVTAKVWPPPTAWTSVCHTYEGASGAWSLYLGGRYHSNGTLLTSSGSAPGEVRGGGHLILGQDHDSFQGGYQADQSYAGLVANVNLWERVLAPREIRDFATCDLDSSGAVVKWDPSSWKLNDTVRLGSAERTDVCAINATRYTLISEALNYEKATGVCQSLSSSVAVPKSTTQNDQVLAIAKGESRCQQQKGDNIAWLGITDEEKEGAWYVAANGVPLAFSNWKTGSPNGGNMENCAVMLTGKNSGSWADLSCISNYQYCFVCESAGPLTLTLRGLCPLLPYDSRYVAFGYKESRPVFQGYSGSELAWTAKEWQLEHPGKRPRAGLVPPASLNFPVGRREWVVTGGGCTDSQNTTQITLTLTTCGSNHFTCGDGTCVPMSQRCNFQTDCPDETDEERCRTVVFPPGYKRSIPPPHSPGPLPVDIQVAILALDINTAAMELILDMSVALRWVDPRLTYYNLKVDNVLNTLTLNNLLDIWSPEVAFSNAKGISHTEVDRETKASILRRGASTRGDFSYTEEVDIYEGKENPVTLSRKYSVKYACNFDLAMYPFDKQECHLEFTLSSAPRQYLVLQQLKEQGVRYEGAMNLIEYTIDSVEMVSNDTAESRYSAQMVNIRFRRRYGYYILTIYIPSIFFVSIAYLTTYFRLSNFQVRAIVSLTSMLVLTTLFSQTSSQLPRTSYFKLVDIWMFGAIGCIFCIIVTQTVIDFVYDPQEASPVAKEPPQLITVGKARALRWHVGKPRAVIIMHSARMVFPVVITIFILSYVTFIALQA